MHLHLCPSPRLRWRSPLHCLFAQPDSRCWNLPVCHNLSPGYGPLLFEGLCLKHSSWYHTQVLHRPAHRCPRTTNSFGWIYDAHSSDNWRRGTHWGHSHLSQRSLTGLHFHHPWLYPYSGPVHAENWVLMDVWVLGGIWSSPPAPCRFLKFSHFGFQVIRAMAGLPNMQIQRLVPAAPTRWRSSPAEALNNTGMDDIDEISSNTKSCERNVASQWNKTANVHFLGCLKLSCIFYDASPNRVQFSLVAVSISRWMEKKGTSPRVKTLLSGKSIRGQVKGITSKLALIAQVGVTFANWAERMF